MLGLRERARKQTELQLDNGTASMADLLSDVSQKDLSRSKRAIHKAQSNLACREIELIKGEL